MMSGKRKVDYTAVLSALQKFVDTAPTRIVLDFEAGMWQAIRQHDFYATTQLQGCLFHFTQSIWKQIQNDGLRQDYLHDEGTRQVSLL